MRSIMGRIKRCLRWERGKLMQNNIARLGVSQLHFLVHSARQYDGTFDEMDSNVISGLHTFRTACP